MKRYNILLTGSAGFIGSSLVTKLLKQGHNIVGIDNLNSYYDKELKYARLKNNSILKNIDSGNSIMYNKVIDSYINENYKFLKLDLKDKENLFDLFKTHNFDLVCNFAGQAGVRYSIDNPDTYISNNIQGFLNILEACKEFNIKNLIYASSSSVYGNNTQSPFNTNDKTETPISLYATTKKTNELMSHTYSSLFKINTIGLRFFTVYGPYGRPDMAMFLFVKAAFDKKTIDVFNKGNMLRDFTYIDDVIELTNNAINKLLKKQKKESFYKLYNIGNNKPVKLSTFIETIEDRVGFKLKKRFLKMQEGDVLNTHSCMKDTIKDLNYIPKTSIKEGINNFVTWYIDYYKIKEEK